MKILWTVPTGASGPPIVAGGLVWTMSQTKMLYGVNPATGATVVSEFTGGVSNHFPTPAVADGLLLVPSAVTVIAFKGPGGTPPPPPAQR
jgi:outer membrane protein assembly factor BamB